MCSNSTGARFFLFRAMTVAAVIGVTLTTGVANGPRFRPEDPQAVDRDAAFDASGVKPRDLSEGYDFLSNTFGEPGERRPIPALNVNTIDEVPDSSWFTNRIGHRAMSIAEIVRGPDIVDLARCRRMDRDLRKGPRRIPAGLPGGERQRSEAFI